MQSYTSIWLHILFATQNRRPLITDAIDIGINQSFKRTCHRHQSRILAMNNTLNHYHLLCTLPKVISVAEFVKDLKGISSFECEGMNPELQWQKGYAAYSVGEPELPHLIAEINDQEEKHRLLSYDPEYDLKLINHPYFTPDL